VIASNGYTTSRRLPEDIWWSKTPGILSGTNRSFRPEVAAEARLDGLRGRADDFKLEFDPNTSIKIIE